jgi:23S rRNA (guanine745-N1)-methyltransferase
LQEISGPVLDVGCGEGYYFTHIEATEKYGIDISKKAVQMASKLLPDANFAVASAFRLPIVDHSCAAVFSVFAPHSFEEYARVLQPGGKWVTITPGPHHLQQMRPKRDQSIDEREERRSEPPAQAQRAERIQFELDLSPSAASDLFSMTPLVWQTAADASPTTHVSVDVWVSSGTSL